MSGLHGSQYSTHVTDPFGVLLGQVLKQYGQPRESRGGRRSQAGCQQDRLSAQGRTLVLALRPLVPASGTMGIW